jgi:hypothetical protein
LQVPNALRSITEGGGALGGTHLHVHAMDAKDAKSVK